MSFYRSASRVNGFTPNTQINITALVDVTLVTLIIYILVAPALELGIDVQLPAAAPHRMSASKPVVISFSKDRHIFYNNILVDKEQLKDRLDAAGASDPDQAVVVRADTAASYGDIIDLLDLVRGAGLVNIGLVTRNKER